MPICLRDIVSPLSEETFRARVGRREVTLFRGTDSTRFDGLASWNTVRHAIEGGALPLKHVRVTKRGKPVPKMFFAADEQRPDPRRVLHLLHEGASVIITPLEPHLPTLGPLIDDIRRETTDRVWTGAIVSTGSGGAFPLHFDIEDLLILQIEGRKRWRISGPPVLNPVRGVHKPAPTRTEQLFDDTLSAGDALLVPAGFWHECELCDERSIHLGIFLEPLSLPMIAAMLTRVLSEDPVLRAPLLRSDSVAALDSSATGVAQAMIDALDRIRLADIRNEIPE